MEALSILKDVLLGLVGLVLTVFWFMFRRLVSRVDGVDNKVADLPKEYVLKDDYKSDMRELKSDITRRFDSIESSLGVIHQDLKEVLKGRN
ncbi:MAG: hypothetical protein GY793_08525 [Proteobacteria bacterium]|nr:hypothetical protein [Pseudomonadota bacterium]